MDGILITIVLFLGILKYLGYVVYSIDVIVFVLMVLYLVNKLGSFRPLWPGTTFHYLSGNVFVTSFLILIRSPLRTEQLTLDPHFGSISLILARMVTFLIKNLEKKLYKSLSDFQLKVIYKTNKIAMFCSNKDPIQKLMKANVVYRFSCPGCFKSYVGKTDRNLVTRLTEHANGKDSAISFHLKNKCPAYSDMTSLFSILNSDFNPKQYLYNTIIDNTSILDRESNWLRLLYLESYYIKLLKPSLNTGARASKELQLF